MRIAVDPPGLDLRSAAAWAFLATVMAPLLAGEPVEPPFFSPDGSQKVCSAQAKDVTGWSVDELARFGQRPDFLSFDAQSGMPPGDRAWACEQLSGHPGRQVGWVESRTVGDRVYLKLRSYFLMPTDRSEQAYQEWSASGRWKELLIQPPVGGWVALQDGKRPSHVAAWGGGPDGQGEVDGLWWGAAKSSLHGPAPRSASIPDAAVKVVAFSKALDVDACVGRLLVSVGYYRPYEAKVHLLAGQVVMGHRLIADKREPKDYWTWSWRSGVHVVRISGDVASDAGLLQVYLAKFPSDLPGDLAISVEEWLVERFRREHANLVAASDTPDEELQPVSPGGVPWDNAMFQLVAMEEGLQAAKDYRGELEGMRKALLEQGRRYDWAGYRSALKDLRGRILKRFSDLVAAMEKDGIRHTGKSFALKPAR